MPGLTLDTLGDLLEHGHSLHASCGENGCPRQSANRKLDLAELVAKHGADMKVADFLAKLRCSACGKPGKISITHDGVPR